MKHLLYIHNNIIDFFPIYHATPGPYNTYPEEPLDSLDNYYDSLNPFQNMNLDYRNKNPYAIPANLNHKIIPDFASEIKPYFPPHSNLTSSVSNRKPNMNFNSYGVSPMVFKEQSAQNIKQNTAFTVDMAASNKPVNSKVFNRLFPTSEVTDKPKEAQARNFHLDLNKAFDSNTKPQAKLPKQPNARSIFKNYKSCPVSPVSEECKWADVVQKQNRGGQNSNNSDPKKRNSLGFSVNAMLPDRGRSIMETIKSDTEKMIAEITKKYGDLDEYEPNRTIDSDLDLQPSKEVQELEKDDGNFSSDSLEDCSLSQDASCKNKLYSKKVCRKHNKTRMLPRRAISNYEIHGDYVEKPVIPAKPSYIVGQKSSTLPRNMPSNFDDIMDEEYSMDMNYNNMYRCQSVLTKRCVTNSNESVLSDNSNCSSVSNEIFMKFGNESGFQQAKINDERYNLNDSQNCSFENMNEIDDQYLDNHRHSSASFFLNQIKYMKTSFSQESILTDESLENDNQLSRTNCNSLESVLSDDSEYTKSAPLEMLFEGSKLKRQHSIQKDQGIGIPRSSKSCYEFDNASKSYGSSPNNAPYFGNYMYNNYVGDTVSPKCRETLTTHANISKPTNVVHGFNVNQTESAVPKTVPRSKSLYDASSKQAPPLPPKNIAYYFDGNNVQQYSKDRKQLDEIPRHATGYMASTTKSLQQKCPNKHKYKSEMEGCEPNTMVKSKSCSFEVVLEPATKPKALKNIMEKKSSHVQKNLEKFEEQIRRSSQVKFAKIQENKEKASGGKHKSTTKSLERGSGAKNNDKMTMEFVPHKPPKPMKRTSSVKLNNRLKSGTDKSGLSSPISSQYKAKLDGLHNKNYLANKKRDNNSNKVENVSDDSEKTYDVFVKEKDVNENKSEMDMDSLEVFALHMRNRNRASLDSLDVLEDHHDNFTKDSLDYYAEQDNNISTYPKSRKEQMNSNLKNDYNQASYSGCQMSKENIDPKDINDELKKYKYIERKIEIINKLVEMEERKILQEKFLKEWRMRPLKANLNDGTGVVKVLSRKFEKLANKSTLPPNFASLTLEEVDTDTENNSENKEIKRNLSLPDILDSDQISGLVTESDEVESTNECGNVKSNDDEILNNAIDAATPHTRPKLLKSRVYNEMVIPKTDVHIDSENYESSTTSSSCTNSPKRLLNRNKIPVLKRGFIRVPTPRFCMESRIFSAKFRPLVPGFRSFASSSRVPSQSTVPQKCSPIPGRVIACNRCRICRIFYLLYYYCL